MTLEELYGKKRTISTFLYVIGFLFMNFGFFFSRFLLSTGMILLVLNFILILKTNVPTLSKKNLIFAPLFLVYLLTGLYSQNSPYYLERLQIILPLLVLPLVFSVIRIKEKQIILWLSLFFSLTLITSCLGLFSFLFYGTKKIAETGPLIGTGVNHVHFSLMISISLLIGIHVLFKKYNVLNRCLRCAFITSIIFFLFFLHFNGVRSGIVGFYSGLVVYSFINIKQITYKKIILPITVMATCFLLMFSYHPHFQLKIVNTFISLEEIYKGVKVTNPSDLGRINSIKTGIELGSENIILGVGLGDIRDEMIASSGSDILPHNQFIFIFSFSGLIGLTIFILTLIKLLNSRSIIHDLFITINIVFLVAFMFEHPLERQISLGLFLYFNLINISE